MYEIRAQVLLVGMFLVALVCPAETLQELLTKTGVPIATFSKEELAENVQGTDAQTEQQIVLGYNKVSGEGLVAPVRLIRYDKASGAIVRANLQLGENDPCDGGGKVITFYRDLTVLDMELSPSAGCSVFVDKSFKVIRELYGFEWFEIAPNQLVSIEDMVHFAPVHAERLQVIDVFHPGSKELYPLKGDALRADFIRENAKHMPSDENCRLVEDPCDPEMFDEDIGDFASDGQGGFALLARLDASHATAKAKPPVKVLSQSILYIYQQKKKGWLYCEQSVADSEADSLGREMNDHFEKVAGRCKPNLPVAPDMTTADFNPLPQN
jgi:hypothetical protein